MPTPAGPDPDLATVTAARDGDRRALDALTAAYLPLVYNIVGRAMNGHPDADDVVQETMLRAVRGIGELRDPAAFRSWLVAIAVRQVRDSYRDRLARPPAAYCDSPVPDFADQAIERLGLSGQRLQAAEATRWLDQDDRPVLSLWWQEAAGELSRAELASGLGLTPAHAAVRVARMKDRLVTSRMIVHALGRVPRCAAIAAITADWDGQPSPLWRKRLARHVKECPWCLVGAADMIPAERLLNGLPLLAVPALLADRTLRAVTGQPAGPGLSRHAGRARAGSRAVRRAGRPRLLARGAAAAQTKVLAVSLALVACAAGGALAVTRGHSPAPTAAVAPASAASSALALSPAPLVTRSAHLPREPQAPSSGAPSRSPAQPASQPAAMAPTTVPPTTVPPTTVPPTTGPPATLTSQRKGVASWNFTGVGQALTQSGASWYYNWGAAPNGIAAPPGVRYVPMIWGAANVTSATLSQVSAEGHVLLGFNEPDLAGQANMSVSQALSLWPRLMATGMTLGSPAVSSGAATPGGWLDQFMAGAKARGYRVDFIAVHWYGGDFATGPAVQQLRSYLEAIYARYHLPIWLTEFALTNFSGGSATFPSQAQQAAFLTAATKMLDGLSFLQRYAWFALPTSAGSGTTGLFNPGPSVTPVGRAFEAAR